LCKWWVAQASSSLSVVLPDVCQLWLLWLGSVLQGSSLGPSLCMLLPPLLLLLGLLCFGTLWHFSVTSFIDMCSLESPSCAKWFTQGHPSWEWEGNTDGSLEAG
jgi:hypothetical protein